MHGSPFSALKVQKFTNSLNNIKMTTPLSCMYSMLYEEESIILILKLLYGQESKKKIFFGLDFG